MITSSIVLYNTDKEELKRVIDCASASIINHIFIVDNSPSDTLRDFITELSSKITYIFNGMNIGYGAGHNIGLRKSIELKADYHVVLNPDIYFDGGTIETLTSYMEKNQDAGAIMPLIKYPDGEIQYLCKLQPTPFDLFGRRFVPVKKVIEKRNHRYELRHSEYNKVLNVPCLSGCFMFLRVSILEHTGMFDEDYFMYCEDFDFYRRIHSKYKTIFYPQVIVYHAHKKESYKNPALLKQHVKSAIRYFNKWGWFFDKDRKLVNKRILDELRKK